MMMKSFNLLFISLLLCVHHHHHLVFVSSLQPSAASKIRALSLDVTGTLLATKEPVVRSYHDAAIWAKMPNPPSESQLKHKRETVNCAGSLVTIPFGV